MDFDLKLHSITRKWLYTLFPIVLLVIIVGEVCVGVALFTSYKNLAMDAASEYVRDINVLSLTDKDGFYKAARSYSQEFAYRDKIEVQIFDADGDIIITTNGFASGSVYEKATDYRDAVLNGGEASWYGKNANGEKVLAFTTVLPDLGYGVNGAYRVLVSMEDIMDRYFAIMVVAVVVGLFALAIAISTGIFFINAIVRPVRDVTAAARKIAGGDFEARLTVKHNDEIGELCDTINYMATELQNAEKQKNDFISSVSHELRTPLTAIKGWGETVKLSVDQNDEIVQHGINVMLGEADRLSGLVEELLDFSRIESGKLTVTLSLCDPLEIVSSVVDMYKEIANQQKISLVFVTPEPSKQIMADRDRIKQVFINIIDNAVKYSTQGDHIVVSAFNEEACLRVTISDTGCGIPAKDLNHIKEKFYKANNNVRGSGIGLAVADEIIKQHNGLLFVESTEGEGTTVTVVLPTVDQTPDEVTEIIFPPTEKG